MVVQAAGWLTAYIEIHHFVQDWKILFYIFTKWECSDIRVENVSVDKENHYGSRRGGRGELQTN